MLELLVIVGLNRYGGTLAPLKRFFSHHLSIYIVMSSYEKARMRTKKEIQISVKKILYFPKRITISVKKIICVIKIVVFTEILKRIV